MKTTKHLITVVSVLIVGGLTLASPVTASCGKKSKAKLTGPADQKTSSQTGMQGMQVSGDMPMCGEMKMANGQAEDQGNTGGPAMESMNAGGIGEMADQKQTQSGKKQAAKVVDPVCHMPVDPKLAEKSVYKGKTDYFCSKGDKEKFEQSPEEYLRQQPKQ